MRTLSLILFTCICQFAFSQSFNLTISITNIKKISGDIKIAVYNNKYTFPHKKEEYRTFTIPVKAGTETYTITDLPKGVYAIALFHDKNSDGKCNTDFWGIPEEGYGFSRNFKPILFAPSFSDCKFDLIANMALPVKLIF